jgi:hypothetical protein
MERETPPFVCRQSRLMINNRVGAPGMNRTASRRHLACHQRRTFSCSLIRSALELDVIIKAEVPNFRHLLLARGLLLIAYHKFIPRTHTKYTKFPLNPEVCT